MTPETIHSWPKLRSMIGYSRDDLERIAAHVGRHYTPFDLRAPGKTKWRHIDNPQPPLRPLQDRIARRVLRPVALPEMMCGSVVGRSPADAVRPHVGSRAAIAMDLRDCFHSTNPHHVNRAFKQEVRCSTAIADLLTKLTTLDFGLPQGAPTSSYLANLALLPAAREIKSICDRANLAVTFFVDDILISGEAPESVVDEVIHALQAWGHGVRREKFRRMGPLDKRRALGLSFATCVGYGRSQLSDLRKSILRLGSNPEVTTRELRRAWGQIYHVRSVNRLQGERLVELAAGLLPSEGLDADKQPGDLRRPCRRHRWRDRGGATPGSRRGRGAAMTAADDGQSGGQTPARLT